MGLRADTLYTILLCFVLIYKVLDLVGIWPKVEQALVISKRDGFATKSSTTLVRLQRVLEEVNREFDKYMLYTLIAIITLVGVVYLVGRKLSIEGFYPAAFSVAVVTTASSLVTSAANVALDWYRNLIARQD